MTMVPGSMVSAGGAARTVVKTQSFLFASHTTSHPSCGVFSPIDDEDISPSTKPSPLMQTPLTNNSPSLSKALGC
jgi:hypothetical protein